MILFFINRLQKRIMICIAAFDFHGTLRMKETLLDFMSVAHGSSCLCPYEGIMALLPYLILYKIG